MIQATVSNVRYSLGVIERVSYQSINTTNYEIELKKAGKNPLFEMVKDLLKRAANGDQEAAESLPRYKTIIEQIKASEK